MEHLIRIFDRIAFGAILFLLFVVVASVLGSILLDITGGRVNLLIPGSIELSKYALLIMVFASLPRAAVHGLVSVELLLGYLPPLVRQILERFWDILLSLFAASICWLFFERTLTMFTRGDHSQDLGIPLYLIYGALTICCLSISLTALWLGIKKKHLEIADES